MKINDSQRLSFGFMGEGDEALFYELDQDAEVMRYINGGKASTMIDIINVTIPRLMSYRNVETGWGIYSVFVSQTNEYIGWILVRPMDFFGDTPEFDNLEIGWRFKASSWGKGYATEAAQAIMDGIGEQTDIERFSAIALEDNEASIKIMKKLGMEYVKTDIHKDPLGDLEVVFYEVSV